jgi:DNA primase
MTPRPGRAVDIDAVRRAHPIHEVIAAAGVDLLPRGKGFIGCCPFHADATPSMSVNGVPDRFHCFGCGASGDVIEFVQRRYGLDFREALAQLGSSDFGPLRLASPVHPQQSEPLMISQGRAYEINAMAWESFADRVGARFAHSWLHNHRGIDVTALEAETGGPLAGRAGSGWTRLVDTLARRGVTPDELLAVDLAQRSRHGHLVDTLRNRVILPVRGRDGRISGFIGRDLTGDPRTPKYRNPTNTVVYDKALSLYRPSLAKPHPDATAVVVEGSIDALAIAAAAASVGQSARVISVSASGTAVSPSQAGQVCALAPAAIVLALDSDQAGRAGTERWLDALTVQRKRLARVAELPDGVDPAELLATTGAAGLAAFGIPGAGEPQPPPPHLPGRELVRVLLPRSHDPIRDTAHELLSIARLTGGRDAVQLLQQAEAEMTRQGWNPSGIFGHYMRSQAAQETRDRIHHPETSSHLHPPAPNVISR